MLDKYYNNNTNSQKSFYERSKGDNGKKNGLRLNEKIIQFFYTYICIFFSLKNNIYFFLLMEPLKSYKNIALEMIQNFIIFFFFDALYCPQILNETLLIRK